MITVVSYCDGMLSRLVDGPLSLPIMDRWMIPGQVTVVRLQAGATYFYTAQLTRSSSYRPPIPMLLHLIVPIAKERDKK